MKIRYHLTIAALFICAGLLLGAAPLQRILGGDHSQTQPSELVTPPVVVAESIQVATDILSGYPIRISIPSLVLDLAVIDGIYDWQSQTWTLSSDKAHFATLTTLPNNQEGNTFIYGHARHQVFASLSELEIGATATITTDNGLHFTYRLQYVTETDPNDDSLFSYEGPPILTLQTCSGFWYQNRQLFTFSLVEVS